MISSRTQSRRLWGGHNVDAFVAIGGCDKNMPGSMIAIANMDIPAIFAYGGTIAPGNLDGKDIDLVSVFEGYRKMEPR